jgi:hypothetical protein
MTEAPGIGRGKLAERLGVSQHAARTAMAAARELAGASNGASANGNGHQVSAPDARAGDDRPHRAGAHRPVPASRRPVARCQVADRLTPYRAASRSRSFNSSTAAQGTRNAVSGCGGPPALWYCTWSA